jgi:sarcosine oxidase/L-pipecolate oxidase
MSNVMKGRSNGEEKDTAWKWKNEEELKQRKRKEFGNSSRHGERKELGDYDDEIVSKL